MKTWCAECDSRRAYVAGRFAAFVGMARTPPVEYDTARREQWQAGYDRQQRRRVTVATSDREKP